MTHTYTCEPHVIPYEDCIDLEITPKTDPRLCALMPKHYSKPKGFVGRSICYAINHNGIYYGHIVGGSCCLHLPWRDEFFGLDRKLEMTDIINNVFFHIEKVDGKYPIPNFAQAVIKEWMFRICHDWQVKYSSQVIGFETLVEPPRTGECYRRLGWHQLSETKGFTCKRPRNRRVWDTTNLRPKLVFVYMPRYFDEYTIYNGDTCGYSVEVYPEDKLLELPQYLWRW